MATKTSSRASRTRKKPAAEHRPEERSLAMTQPNEAPDRSAGADAVGAEGEAGKHGDSTSAKARPRDKVIRDSFSMPRSDYALIAALKARSLALGASVKKSELLRAGLRELDSLGDEQLSKRIGAVESIKRGRDFGKGKGRIKKKAR